MPDPVNLNTTWVRGPLGPIAPSGSPPQSDPGSDFAAMLKDQLRQVNRLQSEADENVNRLMTGEAASVTDVFVAARKAQVAFSLLMEIRNKLVDAYTELQNMRV